MKNFKKIASLRYGIIKNNITILKVKMQILYILIKIFIKNQILKLNELRFKIKRRFYRVTYFIVPKLKLIFIFPAVVICSIVLSPFIIFNILGYRDHLEHFTSKSTPTEHKLAFWEETYKTLIHISFLLYIGLLAFYLIFK